MNTLESLDFDDSIVADSYYFSPDCSDCNNINNITYCRGLNESEGNSECNVCYATISASHDCNDCGGGNCPCH